jgi:hypothetical protein
VNLVAAEQRGEDDYRSDGGSIEGWVAANSGLQGGVRAAISDQHLSIAERAGLRWCSVLEGSTGSHRYIEFGRRA